jgi:limonene 1,2-monooxygenase
MNTPPLKSGIFLAPVHAKDENPTLALERDLQLLEHLDQLGFDEAWIGEHHSTGWETIASPEIFIAAAAARTKHIKLGTGVVPLSIHHPLHVADRLVLLDHLTRGRVLFGMGVGGGLPTDLHVFGVDDDQAYPRFQQAFDLIMRLLTTIDPISEKTDWYEVRDALLQLRPYTQPYMPLAIASNSPASLELVGRWGATWLSTTRAELVPELFAHIEHGAADVGRSADRNQVTLGVSMHLAETRQQALDEIRRGAAEEHFDFNVAVNGAPLPTVSRDEWVEQLAQREIIGTPDDAIARIEAMLATSGGFGGLLIRSKEWAARAEIWRSYELFTRYVMPHFQNARIGLDAAANVTARYHQQKQHQHA